MVPGANSRVFSASANDTLSKVRATACISFISAPKFWPQSQAEDGLFLPVLQDFRGYADSGGDTFVVLGGVPKFNCQFLFLG